MWFNFTLLFFYVILIEFGVRNIAGQVDNLHMGGDLSAAGNFDLLRLFEDTF